MHNASFYNYINIIIFKLIPQRVKIDGQRMLQLMTIDFAQTLEQFTEIIQQNCNCLCITVQNCTWLYCRKHRSAYLLSLCQRTLRLGDPVDSRFAVRR